MPEVVNWKTGGVIKSHVTPTLCIASQKLVDWSYETWSSFVPWIVMIGTVLAET